MSADLTESPLRRVHTRLAPEGHYTALNWSPGNIWRWEAWREREDNVSMQGKLLRVPHSAKPQTAAVILSRVQCWAKSSNLRLTVTWLSTPAPWETAIHLLCVPTCHRASSLTTCIFRSHSRNLFPGSIEGQGLCASPSPTLPPNDSEVNDLHPFEGLSSLAIASLLPLSDSREQMQCSFIN